MTIRIADAKGSVSIQVPLYPEIQPEGIDVHNRVVAAVAVEVEVCGLAYGVGLEESAQVEAVHPGAVVIEVGFGVEAAAGEVVRVVNGAAVYPAVRRIVHCYLAINVILVILDEAVVGCGGNRRHTAPAIVMVMILRLALPVNVDQHNRLIDPRPVDILLPIGKSRNFQPESTFCPIDNIYEGLHIIKRKNS